MSELPSNAVNITSKEIDFKIPRGWGKDARKYHLSFKDSERFRDMTLPCIRSLNNDYKGDIELLGPCEGTARFHEMVTYSSLVGDLKTTVCLNATGPTFKCDNCGTVRDDPQSLRDIDKRAMEVLIELGIRKPLASTE